MIHYTRCHQTNDTNDYQMNIDYEFHWGCLTLYPVFHRIYG